MCHFKEFWLLGKVLYLPQPQGWHVRYSLGTSCILQLLQYLLSVFFFFRFDKIDVYITQAWHEMKQFLKFIFVPD